MKQSQRIVKNVLAGGLGVGVGGVLQLGTVVLIARSVTVTQFGVYSFVLAFAMFFQLLADSGLSNILVRELAKYPARIGEILGAANSLTWLLTAVAAVLMLALAPFLHFGLNIKGLALLMGVATLAQFHATIYGSVLRSQEDNEWHALGFLLHKVLFCLCVFAGLQVGLGLLGIVIAHLVPNLFQWAFYYQFVKKRYARPCLRIDVPEWKYLLTHSLPVGGATMLRLLGQQIDVMILTWMSDLRTVGMFSGPYRIAQAMRFVPQTMSIPLYPMYARLASEPESRPQLQLAYERSVKAFLVAGCAVAALFVACAPRLIALLLGPAFGEATLAMQIIGIAFLPFFISNPYPFLFTALHDQRFLLWSTIISLVLRVVLNFLLIPPLGFIGPSLAFLGGEIVLLFLSVYRMWRLGFPLDLLRMSWRPLLAGFALALILYPTRFLPVFFFIPAAVIASFGYLVLIFKLGIFSGEEIQLAREGMRFLEPLLAKWRGQPQAKAT